MDRRDFLKHTAGAAGLCCAGGAVAELAQSDFRFQTPSVHGTRPRYWDVRVRENCGKTAHLVFEHI